MKQNKLIMAYFYVGCNVICNTNILYFTATCEIDPSSPVRFFEWLSYSHEYWKYIIKYEMLADLHVYYVFVCICNYMHA